MTVTQQIPFSQEAEWSVVSQILSKPNAIAEVIGTQVQVEDFYRPDTRLIFETAVECYYADDQVDAVAVGERLRAPLSRQWQCEEEEVAGQLYSQAASRSGRDTVTSHAALVRSLSDKRRILAVMDMARAEIAEGHMTPEEIGDMIGTETTKIVTGTKTRGEIMPFLDVGREYVKYLRRLRLARERGIELAVYTGLKFIDDWTKGITPTELCMIAGEPGVGKSAVTWKMAEGFARRQLLKPAEQRIGTMVLSLEMGLVGSSGRLATSLTGIDSDKLREGDVSDDELAKVIKMWKDEAELPLYWNFASNFRFSQMRALVVESIRRHNVGLVVVDHFRMFDPDRRINNANQEDEAKVRFLKEDIAKDLNVAVIVLAHTVKIRREGTDGRPQLSDLRGSYQVAAHCDQVAFMYSPYMYATENEKLEGVVQKTEAEMLYRKNRSGALGASDFFFNPATMAVRDEW